MSPWAGGHTDATVTMGTDTEKGPRRGTLQLRMGENPPHTVSPRRTQMCWVCLVTIHFPPFSSICLICCSRHPSSEGAVPVGDRGRWRGTHPSRPVHRAGWNLPQGGGGRRMEGDSQVHWVRVSVTPTCSMVVGVRNFCVSVFSCVQVVEVWGGCWGWRRAMEQTLRSHSVSAQSVRAAQLHHERHRDAGHEGQLAGGDCR